MWSATGPQGNLKAQVKLAYCWDYKIWKSPSDPKHTGWCLL